MLKILTWEPVLWHEPVEGEGRGGREVIRGIGWLGQGGITTLARWMELGYIRDWIWEKVGQVGYILMFQYAMLPEISVTTHHIFIVDKVLVWIMLYPNADTL